MSGGIMENNTSLQAVMAELVSALAVTSRIKALGDETGAQLPPESLIGPSDTISLQEYHAWRAAETAIRTEWYQTTCEGFVSLKR